MFPAAVTSFFFFFLPRAGSYYPLYPPSEELNIDYETFYSYASLPVTPDVLITPSELRYFVKVSWRAHLPKYPPKPTIF